MLTRLRVTGFKNLVDVDVRFGPFTCIAGANGVGKSNLLDAIRFLSALADMPIMKAAQAVRDEHGSVADVRGILHAVGDYRATAMRFEAEMVVPTLGVDDLGQSARASATLLRYAVEIGTSADDTSLLPNTLELVSESLVKIEKADVPDSIRFPCSVAWLKSVGLPGKGRTAPFIATVDEGGGRIIKVHQEGRQGRPSPRAAGHIPRTVLSTTLAADTPTALLARREMQSWRLLQFEPSALRRPDDFNTPGRLGADGSHLPATLDRLARQARAAANGHADASEAAIYQRVANRLMALIHDGRRVWVDRDERHELLTLIVTGRDGTAHRARSLSDGTLRFLALAVLDLDPEAIGVIGMEEPENGIHPLRIPAMLELLADIAVDPTVPVEAGNPLRQVIVNTHSPAVVGQVVDDSLLVAESRDTVVDGRRFNRVVFGHLSGTWRDIDGDPRKVVDRGQLLAYLEPDPEPARRAAARSRRRVRDRDEIKGLFDAVDARP